MTTRTWTLLTLLAGLASVGGTCGTGGGTPPAIVVTFSGIDETLNDLLVIPSDAAGVLNASFTQGSDPVAPGTVSIQIYPWDGGAPIPQVVWSVDATQVTALYGAGTLSAGSWTAVVWVSDTQGRIGVGQLSFAVRDRPQGPAIGTGQQIWLDFESDRDATPGADFPIDLETFGLGSPVSPPLSAIVEQDVIDRVVARVESAYTDLDPAGLGIPDGVDVVFATSDPGSGDVTQICIGGNDISGQGVIGSILIDPNNANRNSVECGTLPPTGIFPREMDTYAGQSEYDETFDPLLAGSGGTPVGEHALDPIVLDPGFDPGSATQPEIDRYDDIQTAIERYGDALGTIVAHEAGHALGLVMPGAPGVGLHGGSAGNEFSHDVEADGVTSPYPNYLMKHGGTFPFRKLAGLSGHPLAYFRALDWAYLRDRVMTDSKVTQLLPPPALGGIDPSTISGTQVVTVTGSQLAATPALRFVNQAFTYNLLGETWISETEVEGTAVGIQIPSGLYDLELENPDGQKALLPDAVLVP